MNRKPVRRVRLNTQPPAGATYFDPTMLTCSPCQSGSTNYCQSVQSAGTTDDKRFDWLFASPRGPGGVAAAPVAAAAVGDCCTTALNSATGQHQTTCDTEKGCGWVAGPFITDQMSCKFTTQGATYETVQACEAAHPPAGTGPTGTHVDWFAPCGPDNTSNCYYPNVDACMPAVFGKQRKMAAAAKAQCRR